jgi:hypothetical protein
MSSDNEDPNPDANDTPTCFTINHYKWLLQYQQLFQFYLVHGHTNVTRRNADNSLAEWAPYQRSKMRSIDKNDQKWKHLLNGIRFCSSPPPTHSQVFEKQLVSYNVLRRTRNAITPNKSYNKALHGWWKYWQQQGKQFLQGGGESKTMICRKYSIYILQAYSAAIHLKCKMAFHLECTNCKSHRECITAIQH